jgi:Flp pilus assembly protein CpaB
VSAWDLPLRRLRRFYLRYRRVIAAVAASIAVLLMARVMSPPPAETVPVVVATHDVNGGAAIAPEDVRVARMPPALVPHGAFLSTSRVVGSTVAAPLRAGEPLTDRRVLGRSLIAGYAAGLVAAPVRIQDSDVVRLLRPGDSIDVYAATSSRGPASLIAGSAPVVMLPQVDPASQTGALVVLAVTPLTAARLAAASATSPLSLTLRS